MANENPSRESGSKQQSSERAQSSPTTSQQGSSQRAGGQGPSGGSGSGTGGTYGTQGQGTAHQGGSGQGQGGFDPGASARQGTSTWQGGALQRRGGSAPSPYGSGYEGYGSGPFSIMRRISDEMDRFFENFGMGRSLFGQDQGWNEGQSGSQAPSMWSPHVEVCERNGKLLIQADLPGIKRDDINVRIEQDSVVIQGQRHQQQTSNERGYYRSERSYGSFYRTIPLPEGTNADSATASFRDGVLEIEFDAPREQQRGRTLEIREGGGTSGASGGSYAGSGAGSYGSSGSAATPGSHTGTGSGSTYGSGTTGSVTGSTSGASQHPASGSSAQQSGSGASGAQQ